MAKTIFVLILVIILIGSLGTAVFLFQSRKSNQSYWDKVHMAEAMIQSKDYENAVKMLIPVVEAGKRFEGAAQAMNDLASTYEVAGSTQAYKLWERLANEFPKSEYHDPARLQLADDLFKTNIQQALKVYQDLQKSEKSDIRGQAVLGIARILESENKIEEARALCKQIISASEYQKVHAPAKDFLSKIHTQMLWSPNPDEFTQMYEVQRGDSPARIANKFKTTEWYIMEANKLEGAIRAGRNLKVPKVPFWIIVDKDNCHLNLLLLDGTFIKWYPVGIGDQSFKTPAGEYKIINKEINPTWFKPTGGVVKPGDPENALGIRWMGIGNSLGIHGTNAPETIGFRKSAGCIRMFNPDVEELYKLATYGTRVTIIEATGTIKASS